MVNPGSIMEKAEIEAERIKKIMYPFTGLWSGHSGFYCNLNKGNFDCLKCFYNHTCPSSFFYQHKYKINPKDETCKYDWTLMWIYYGWDAETTFHPELRNIPKSMRPKIVVNNLELAELLGSGIREYIRKEESQTE